MTFAIGDVADDAGDQQPGGRAQGAEADLDGELTAILAAAGQFQSRAHRSCFRRIDVAVPVADVGVR